MIGRYLVFWYKMVRYAATGGRAFYAWIGTLAIFVLMGAISYVHHVTEGLAVTNMSDQVSWGIGIANFVYFVGVAAAAVVLVVPAYIYHRKDMKEVVLLGELLAVVAVVMCLLFITTDVGRPDRLWHLSPGIGVLNLPYSLLAWDVVVFSGYLIINLHIPGYVLFKTYSGEKPRALLYLPLVFVSMLWAVSIHTVTAFLLSGLGSRHFWNTAVLAPRFLISAGASGPALLIIIFASVRRFTALKVKESVFDYLKIVLRICMPVNLFLLGCEVFKELYTGGEHGIGARYLFFGIGEHTMLPKYIWTAIVFNITATIIFLVPKLRENPRILFTGLGLTLLGVWTEKGMGLIFPGFIPSPLGEIVEYSPNAGEIFVSVGILCLGALVFTLMAKVAIGIQTGQLRLEGAPPLGEVDDH
jgi:molybdopterin-containing oxidoreductase family membrane subunit